MQQDIFFEKLLIQYNSRLPFVVYRKPGEEHVSAFLQQQNELHFVEDFSETGFVFAPFDSNEQAIIFPEAKCEKLLLNAFTGEVRLHGNATSTVNEKDLAGHVNLVANGVATLKDEEPFKKVVLSRMEVLKAEDIQPLEVYKNMLLNYPNAFCYCWYHPQIGVWLGATPETLLQVYRNKLTTMALAGTQKFTDTTEVSWGAKEREEQQLVTDTIVAELNAYTQQVQVSDVYSHKAGSLLHLRTDITAMLPASLNLKPVLQALHPTPAVCGLPKERAKTFILENEHYKRTYYSGFLGELNLPKTTERNTNRKNVENSAYKSTANATHLFVNLRCMEFVKDEIHLFVGGGITASSDPEAEWQETVNKTMTMKTILTAKIPSKII